MILELSNGQQIQDPSETHVKAALLELDGTQNRTLTLQKGALSSLKVVRDAQSHYYFYSRQATSQKQAVQPVSQHIAQKVLLEYAQGKASWKKAIRFEKVKPDDLEDHVEEEQDLSEAALQAAAAKRKKLLWLILPFDLVAVGVVFFAVNNAEAIDLELGLRIGGVLFALLAVAVSLVWKQLRVK